MESVPPFRQLWVLRWLYFFFFVTFGIFMTFGIVYFRSIGLKGAELGLVFTFPPLMSMVGGPVWGMLSDRFRNPRLCLLIAALGGSAAMLAMSFATTLAAITAAIAIYMLFACAFIPLLDSINLGLLGGNRDRYGRQRMWGSLGFIFGSWLYGFVLQQVGLHALFYGSVAGLLLLLPGLAMLKVAQPEAAKLAPWSGFMHFVRQPRWLLFALCLVLIGVVNTAMTNYLGIYIKELNGGEALIGTAAALGVVTELPVMYYSSNLLRRLGNRGLIAIGFCFFAVRMFLYGSLTAPNWVLAIALLHGFTYAPFWVGSVSYASEIAPENLRATAQGMLMFLVGLSGVIGSPVNGGLYDWLGSARLFLVNGGLAVVALLVLGLGAKKRRLKTDEHIVVT